MAAIRNQILAFAWYHESDYIQLLEVSRNREGLVEDYQAWLLAARRALVEYKRLGFEPQRVYIDVQQYVDWCARRERAINLHSREIFKEIKRQEFYRHLDALDAQHS